MPTSHPYQIDDIIRLIIETAPKNIIDVGVGFGKYGVLAREYLELWDGIKPYHNWNHRIDGIDAFKSYLTPLHDFIYDNIYIGNAIDVLPTLEIRYDLLLIGIIIYKRMCPEFIFVRRKFKNYIESRPITICH